MTGKPGASGGARDGAGRPLSTYKGNQYTGETPTEKLWQWLAERCGQEIANEAHLYFNEQKRSYEKQKVAERKETMANERKIIPAPEVFSTLEGGMVPTGRDLIQCECGFWMSDRKPSPSEDREHNRQHDAWERTRNLE